MEDSRILGGGFDDGVGVRVLRLWGLRFVLIILGVGFWGLRRIS